METKIAKYTELSNKLYKICTKKELIRKKCEKLGRVECDMLNLLYHAEKPYCMKELAGIMGVTNSRITRLIDALVRKKMVKRFPSKRDRRVWQVEITENGKASNEKTNREFLSIQEKVIDYLPKENVDTIFEHAVLYLDAYIKVLENIEVKK